MEKFQREGLFNAHCNSIRHIYSESTKNKTTLQNINRKITHYNDAAAVCVSAKKKNTAVSKWNPSGTLSLLHSPHFIFICDVPASLCPSFPPIFSPFYCSLPPFSPQGSYITSTQLIFSKMINELHCVCVHHGRKLRWMVVQTAASECEVFAPVRKCVLLHISVFVCVW